MILIKIVCRKFWSQIGIKTHLFTLKMRSLIHKSLNFWPIYFRNGQGREVDLLPSQSHNELQFYKSMRIHFDRVLHLWRVLFSQLRRIMEKNSLKILEKHQNLNPAAPNCSLAYLGDKFEVICLWLDYKVKKG